MRQLLIAVSLSVACLSVALVAQSRYLPTSPGTWKPWRFTAYPDDRRLLGALPADVKALEAHLLRLNAILKKTDGITNPIGFSVETAGSLDPEPARSPSTAGAPALTARPLPGLLNFGAYPVMEFGSGATAKRDDTGETAQLLFYVNQLSQPLFSTGGSSVPEFDALDTDVARLPAPQPDVLGFARYGDTLVITKNAAPVWAAATFGETLALVARGIDLRLANERDVVARVQAAYDDMKDPQKREARLAQYRKLAPMQKDPAFMDKMTKAEAQKEKQADTLLPQIAAAKAVVTKSEADLAAVRGSAAGLSASEKGSPACYASREATSVSRFRSAPAPGCEPLVRPNWKLFNPALPRSAPQVLTIAHFEQCLVADRTVLHPGGCEANKRLLESIDKAALSAWLQ